MTHLARRLRLVDYFALAFGVMVGTAWLVVMDDILHRGAGRHARLEQRVPFLRGEEIALRVADPFLEMPDCHPRAGAEHAVGAA